MSKITFFFNEIHNFQADELAFIHGHFIRAHLLLSARTIHRQGMGFMVTLAEVRPIEMF